MQERHLPEILAQVEAFIAPLDAIYLTIDLDVLPAAVAPGVSAPSALWACRSRWSKTVADRVCASGKLRVADCPNSTPNLMWTDIRRVVARLAARMVSRLEKKME